ncbi:hypothetical protein [uncultured Fibrobacter sp.]|uniref:hypothetical protein n=1 Tax=uncultured Fibrobacter sp. TaxID=261512 RepID=UPI0025F1426A|nr:hypothetical protein [uncultured Fibrobacter sp.]
MNEQTKKTIAETLHMKIQTPWIWLVVVLTICLTALFYISQKPQVAVYSQYVKSLCDYQFADASLMRSMERVRSGNGVDSAIVLSQMMALREVALSFDAGIQKLEQAGFSAPPAASVSLFKSSVLAKVSCLQRYLSERMAWHAELGKVYRLMEMNPSDVGLPLMRKLDSARAGYAVVPDDLVLPESINKRVESLFQKNVDLYEAWNQFDNDKTLSVSDELLHFFQMENLKEISLSEKVPLAFYFLSLVLLLATFFFIFKSKQ